MDKRVAVQFAHKVSELGCWRSVGGKLVFDGVKTKLCGLLVLGAHIGSRCGIVPDKDDRQPWTHSPCRERIDALFGFLVNFLRDGRAVNPLHFATGFPPVTARLSNSSSSSFRGT